MYLPVGHTARLVLKDGTTVVGTAAHALRWGVHKLRKVRVPDRLGDEMKLSGHLLIPKGSVWFVQIMPPDTEE